MRKREREREETEGERGERGRGEGEMGKGYDRGNIFCTRRLWAPPPTSIISGRVLPDLIERGKLVGRRDGRERGRKCQTHEQLRSPAIHEGSADRVPRA